jgi:V/A-type H+-transporting ATPase subunit A
MLTLLEQQSKLERMVRIVGREALPPAQQYTLLCAELVNEAVLRQSAMSKVDRYCSPQRQTAILRAVMHFIASAGAALERGIAAEAVAALPTYRELMRVGEEIPEAQLERFEELRRRIDQDFQSLVTRTADARPAAG